MVATNDPRVEMEMHGWILVSSPTKKVRLSSEIGDLTALSMAM
jgi:hypothetical protein